MPSAFLDRENPPAEPELHAVLKRSAASWIQLQSRIASDYAPLTEKWTFSGKAHGWGLQLKRKKRTVLYLGPREGHFVVAFILGAKAFEAALRSDLPREVLEIIEAAPKYPEGRAVRLEIRTKKELASVEALAAIKMAN